MRSSCVHLYRDLLAYERNSNIILTSMMCIDINTYMHIIVIIIKIIKINKKINNNKNNNNNIEKTNNNK